MYSVGYFIGYFFVLILFGVLAVCFAKTKAAWVLLGIGAGIQLLAMQDELWGIYLLLVAAGVCGVLLRKGVITLQPKNGGGRAAGDNRGNAAPDGHLPEGYWRCRCGNVHNPYTKTCSCGLTRDDVI